MRHFKVHNLILILIVLFAIILRFVWLDIIPNSLYSDEIDQGYNAYSVLLTGKDEHGLQLPISFRSFGDWKPPVQTYLMIPSIALLGLNELSVRLPSAFFGILSVILGYLLVIELFRHVRLSRKIALLTAFFITISPWHILQSRSAMLVMISLFFLQLGIYAFIKALHNPILFLFSSISFVLTIYSYYGMRVITPLIVFGLFIFYKNTLFQFKKNIILALLLAVFLLAPLGFSYLKNPDVVLGRAKTVSVFYDQGIKLRLWELISQDGLQTIPRITQFFHNSPAMYVRDIIRRFLSHFEGIYLILVGDKASPFYVPNMGILYVLDFFLIPIGLLLLYSKRYPYTKVIIVWLIISIIPSALTFMTPSSNRTFNAVVPELILSALGLTYLSVRAGKLKNVLVGVCVIIYGLNFGYFLHQYFLVVPSDYAYIWNYGYKQLAQYLIKHDLKYDTVYVSDLDGMPYIYLLFYGKVNPLTYQKDAVRTYVADRFGFEHVQSFGKYIYLDDFDWKKIRDNTQKKSLYVVPVSQTDKNEEGIKTIHYPNGKPAYKLFAYE